MLTAEHLAAVSVLLPENTPDQCEELAAVLFAGLSARKIPDAAALAVALTDAVREHFGGSQLYIPTGVRAEVSSRNGEIFAAFNGRNYQEIARRHGLTERQVRSIIATVARIELEKRQQALF